MKNALIIILVILTSLLLWIDIVYKQWLEEAMDELKPCKMEAIRLRGEWEKCEDNFDIIKGFHCEDS